MTGLEALKLAAREASDEASTMRGLPNEIARQEGYASGLEEAFYTMEASDSETAPPANDGPADAIEAVWSSFRSLCNSPNLSSQADALIALSNAVSDLATFHPNYDLRLGEIVGVDEFID